MEWFKEEVNTIEVKDQETIELIKEANHLKNNIQRITKSQAIKSLAKFAAKFKMKGIGFAKPVFKTAKDEAMEYVISKLIDGSGDIISGWIS